MTSQMLVALGFSILIIIFGLLIWYRLDRFVDAEILSDWLRPIRQEAPYVWRNRLRYLGLTCAILGVVALLMILSGRVNLQ